MKTIEYYIINHQKIHITKRGNKMLIWWDQNGWYLWMAPVNKLWQSKKYKKSDIKLINISNV